MLQCIEHYKVKMVMLVPYAITDLLNSDLDRHNLESLQIIYSRSSPLNAKTIEKVKQRLPKLKNILQGYGMIECGEISTENWAVLGPKAGSVGMVSPGITLKIVCPTTNQSQGPNEYGEIRIKGSNLMQGYVAATPESCLDEEGFFKTGDLGYYDEDKYVYVIDRIKEVIVYKEHKFGPTELEAIIQMHPSVLEVAVISVSDPVNGNLPVAFIVKRPNHEITSSEIMDFLSKNAPLYMQLRGGLKFVTKIPRNERAKTLRQKLRSMLN